MYASVCQLNNNSLEDKYVHEQFTYIVQQTEILDSGSFLTRCT